MARKRVTLFSTLIGVDGIGGSLSTFVSRFLHSVYFTLLTISSLTGQQLKKNLEKAWKFAKVQGNIAATLTGALNPTAVESWQSMMEAFYLDAENPNPFEERVPCKLSLFLLFPSC